VKKFQDGMTTRKEKDSYSARLKNQARLIKKPGFVFRVFFRLGFGFGCLFSMFTLSHPEKLLAVGIRTHGRGTFFVTSNKESTQRKCRPDQSCL